jgi:hypothetical protein
MGKALQMRRRSASAPKPTDGSASVEAAVRRQLELEARSFEDDPEGSAAGLHWPLRFLGELRDARSGVAQQPFAYFDGERAS